MASIFTLFIATLFISSIWAHSQMRCAKYDIATGTCHAPTRNDNYTKLGEAYEISRPGTPICQFPMSNPISASYSNGAGCPDWAPCPLPMGTYKQGETFTIMWFARNHATPDQNPGNIVLYLSPVEQQNQGADVDRTAFTAICQAPYMSCGGVNVDQTPCTATCTMPTTAAVGIHTLWWKWDWQSAIYSTCADIVVTAATSSSSTPSTPTTPTTPPTTPSSSSSSSSSSTTGRPSTQPSSSSTSTTGRPSTQPSSSSSSSSSSGRPSQSSSTTGQQQSSSSSGTPTTPTTPSTPTCSSSSKPTTCNDGDMICVGPNHYQTCARYMDGAAFRDVQSCQAGLVCTRSIQSPNKIICDRP